MKLSDLKLMGNAFQAALIGAIVILSLKNYFVSTGEEVNIFWIFWISVIVGLIASISAIAKSIEE